MRAITDGGERSYHKSTLVRCVYKRECVTTFLEAAWLASGAACEWLNCSRIEIAFTVSLIKALRLGDKDIQDLRESNDRLQTTRLFLSNVLVCFVGPHPRLLAFLVSCVHFTNYRATRMAQARSSYPCRETTDDDQHQLISFYS